MPVFHYTQHAHASWLPDKERGYVHHQRGLQRTDRKLADDYRSHLTQRPITFLPNAQKIVIQTLLDCRVPLDLDLHSVATDQHHLHAVLAWRDEREEHRISRSVKTSLTRVLNERLGKRKWFTKGCDMRRVKDREHLRYLAQAYHPSHRGWTWSLAEGWKEPRE